MNAFLDIPRALFVFENNPTSRRVSQFPLQLLSPRPSITTFRVLERKAIESPGKVKQSSRSLLVRARLPEFLPVFKAYPDETSRPVHPALEPSPQFAIKSRSICTRVVLLYSRDDRSSPGVLVDVCTFIANRTIRHEPTPLLPLCPRGPSFPFSSIDTCVFNPLGFRFRTIGVSRRVCAAVKRITIDL